MRRLWSSFVVLAMLSLAACAAPSPEIVKETETEAVSDGDRPAA